MKEKMKELGKKSAVSSLWLSLILTSVLVLTVPAFAITADEVVTVKSIRTVDVWDIAVTGAGRWLDGWGFGSLGELNDVAMGNIDGDTTAELVTANSAGYIDVWDISATGQETWLSSVGPFGPPDSTLNAIAMGDIDGDNRAELVTANSAGFVDVWDISATGQLTWLNYFSLGGTLNGIAMGDIDGDNTAEVVTAKGNCVDVFDISATGQETWLNYFCLDAPLNAIAMGDIDGDNRVEVLTAKGNCVDVFDISATGQATWLNYFCLDAPLNAIAMGDINGDNKDEVLTAKGSCVDVFNLSATGQSTWLNYFCVSGTLNGIAMGDIRPEPSSSITLGAYYYPWFGDGATHGERRHWKDGYLRYYLDNPHTPYLGEYNSQSMATVNKHLDWANLYGIDYFMCSWFGANSYEDTAVKDYLIQSPNIGNVKIGIFYETPSLISWVNEQIYFDAAAEAKLISDFSYLAQTYFGNPNYYKTADGRPIVYLYVTRCFTGNYATALRNLRSTILQNYGYNLYLVGDEVYWGSPNKTRIATLDAITAYNMHGPTQYAGYPDNTNFLPAVQSKYNQFKNAAASKGVRFIPGVFPAFNSRGFIGSTHYAIPHEVNSTYGDVYTTFSQFLNVGWNTIDTTLDTITITSWNEWAEDTGIEPTSPANPSSGPTYYTQGYTYYSYGYKLLEGAESFKASH